MINNTDEPEPRTYSFPKRVWDLLLKHNIITIEDGFDATESFRNHCKLLHGLDFTRLNTYPSNIANAYKGALISREAMLEMNNDVSARSQNVFGWLMFHVMLESHKNLSDIVDIPSEDMSLMLGALLEILDAPFSDVLKNNL